MTVEKDLKEGTSVAEWIVAGLGAALIAATIGYLIYFGLSRPDTPPDVSVRTTGITDTSGGYLLEFTATNEGNTTATSLTIMGRLLLDGQIMEEAEIVLDHLSPNSESTGGMIFRNDPAAHDVAFIATGYLDP